MQSKVRFCVSPRKPLLVYTKSSIRHCDMYQTPMPLAFSVQAPLLIQVQLPFCDTHRSC